MNFRSHDWSPKRRRPVDRHRDSRQIHHETEDEALVACCEDVGKFKIQYINAKKKIIVCAKLYISEVLIDFVTSTITVVGSTSNRY